MPATKTDFVKWRAYCVSLNLSGSSRRRGCRMCELKSFYIALKSYMSLLIRQQQENGIQHVANTPAVSKCEL